MLFRSKVVKVVEMFPGVKRKTLATEEKLMLTEFTYEKGARVPIHKHPNEQISYVVEGKYKVTIGRSKIIAQRGESYLVPPGVEHSQYALERTVTVDVFSPPREDYREK